MDLKELISYFIEPSLFGKRFLIAIGILIIWAYCIVFTGTVPDGVTNLVGMVSAFYLGAHNGTGNATIEATPLPLMSTATFVGTEPATAKKEES